ncbi:MAG: single-stranded DNA-binding protein [Oscillibacter sp.]|nr:single-stranded DNA-binding protein [Oscillibacter sp.]
MLNKVSIMGRLVRDPELRRTQSGIAVTTMRIAVDRDFKSQDGTKQADFFDVVAWRNTAEFASRYFFKGRLIIVDGRLQTREWTDREGNKRTSVEIVADNIYFGDSKRDNPNNNGEFNGGYGGAPGYGAPSGGYGSGYGSSGYASYGNPSGGYGGGYGAGNGFASNPGSGYGSNNGAGYGSGYGGYSPATYGGGYDNAAPAASPAPAATTEESSSHAPAADTASGTDSTPSGFAELADDDGDLPF